MKLERIFHLSIPGFAVLWIGAKFFFEDFNRPGNYTASLECLLLVGVSFRTLYVVNKEQVKTIFQEPRLLDRRSCFDLFQCKFGNIRIR